VRTSQTAGINNGNRKLPRKIRSLSEVDNWWISGSVFPGKARGIAYQKALTNESNGNEEPSRILRLKANATELAAFEARIAEKNRKEKERLVGTLSFVACRRSASGV